MNSKCDERKAFVSICEELGWNVDFHADEFVCDVILERWANNGMDCYFSFHVGTSDFYMRAFECVRNEWLCYDPLEECELSEHRPDAPSHEKVLDDCYECEKHLFHLTKVLLNRFVDRLPKCHYCGTLLNEKSYEIDSKPDCRYCSPECLVKELTGDDLRYIETVFGGNQ